MIGRPDICFRCSTCGISYPKHGKCQVCGGALSGVQDKPDDDWEDKVRLALGKRFEDVPGDEVVYGWRMHQLVVECGAPHNLAERIALDRSIDLHMAMTVFKNRPDMAEAILL